MYARLAEDAEIRLGDRTPPPWSRWAGWLLCLALVAGVVVAAVRVQPW